MKATDSRITAINELLQGVRIIKFFSWETQFETKIEILRMAEIQQLWLYVLANSGSRIIWNAAPVIVSLVTFTTLTMWSGERLTASTAFTALALFNSLRNPLTTMPDIIVRTGEALVSLARIEAYLAEPELDHCISKTPSDTTSLLFQKESLFSWFKPDAVDNGRRKQRGFMLKDLCLDFPLGGLTVIHGPTGAGKSSLLAALLGELHCIKGGVTIGSKSTESEHDPIAYASQLVWLLNSTIRQNILFGEVYDARKYSDTIAACALIRDFETLDSGDMTEIGEKGVNLSGGQKARISLARALYSTSKVVLLDDPLSAVDAPTAKHLFENAICGPLMAGRTRILVTHAVALCLPMADLVVAMNHGVILNSTTQTPASVISSGKKEGLLAISGEAEAALRDSGKLIQDESRFHGTVPLGTYWLYARAAGGALFILSLAVAYGSAQILTIGDDWWLKIWADTYQQYLILDHGVSYYVLTYAILSTLTVVAFFFRVIIVAYGSLRASKELHKAVLHKILRSPIRFFETTPLGRILNRFSKDMKDIDQEVAFYTGDFIGNFVRCASFLVVIMIMTPSALIGIIPVGIIYVIIAQKYLFSARELKRLESNSRSPIFSHFGETISGASVVRAYATQNRFVRELRQKVDMNHQAFSLMWIANRWLGLRIDIFGAVVTLSSSLSIIYAVHSGAGMNAGAAGLSITYALSFTEALLWLVRMHALMEMEMNAVERLDEYLQLEEEAPSEVLETRPYGEWPSEGNIQVTDLSIRYSPTTDLVLSNISFSVAGGQKLGIVGRTGAGKSTLSIAFFRFIEYEHGTILIDGHDISKMGLHDLRSRLTIIPQDPVLFSGSLRSNLDPLDEFSDLDLWTCLDKAGFLASIAQARHREASAVSVSSQVGRITLEAQVDAGGANFSQGQRQLLCLARALLRNSKMIIMDEATASVDAATDTRIQQTIRTEFAHATLLCIAHRLRLDGVYIGL